MGPPYHWLVGKASVVLVMDGNNQTDCEAPGHIPGRGVRSAWSRVRGFDGIASSASRGRNGLGAEATGQTPIPVDRFTPEVFQKREGTVEPRETRRFCGAGHGQRSGGMKSCLDTTFIVRLLTEEPPDQAIKAREELESCLRRGDRPTLSSWRPTLPSRPTTRSRRRKRSGLCNRCWKAETWNRSALLFR